MDDISDREHYSKEKTMKKIDATVWMSDEHDANMVGDRTWITIRIGDHEILVNVDRWEIDDALEDLEDEKESQLILKRMRASDQTSH